MTDDERSGGVATAGTTGSAGRILVVDDDEQIRKLLGRLLRAAGHAVDTAADGESALVRLRAEPPDVIVSDIVMPGMTGIELMRAVREVDLDTPIILLTGTPSLATAREAVELGAFRYLTKPVDNTALGTVVERALVARRMARLKRAALALGADAASRGPGDLAGLEVTFGRALVKLWMAYQPIVRASDGSLYGYEALLRSDEPALPHPGAMLAAAERLGRVLDLGRLVRTRAAAPIPTAPAGSSFFVNLHPEDLLDDALLLADAPLSAHAGRVVLEVTERATIDNMSAVRDRVRRLREMGFRIAVDDLGAGYAGLTSFATLEPDVVKLDMSLTRDVDSSPTKQRIVAAMVGLCRQMGTIVVAEGIETTGERDAVSSLGCDLVQGYLVARPGRPFPTISW